MLPIFSRLRNTGKQGVQKVQHIIRSRNRNGADRSRGIDRYYAKKTRTHTCIPRWIAIAVFLSITVMHLIGALFFSVHQGDGTAASVSDAEHAAMVTAHSNSNSIAKVNISRPITLNSSMKQLRVIGYSLFGNPSNLCYVYGALENALIAQQLFPGWRVRVYVDSSFLKLQPIQALQQERNVDLVEMNATTSMLATMWRFQAALDTNVDVAIFRDVDSRLTVFDRLSVAEWLESDQDFHIIRDSQFHSIRILAGMWGVRNHKFMQFKSEYDAYFAAEAAGNKSYEFGVDQHLLKHVVYSKIIAQNDVFIHDSRHFFQDEQSVHILHKSVGDEVSENKDRFIGAIRCTGDFKLVNQKFNLTLTNLKRAAGKYAKLDYT